MSEIDIDVVLQLSHIATSLESLAEDVKKIRWVVEDLDEVEEMYKDYPAKKDYDWEKWRKNE